VDAFDIEPFIDCITMGGGVFCTSGVAPPPTGTFLLHGRPADVLSDGKVLLYVRARFYDPEHGRWLQRDPSGYSDGGNLYESFRSNASRFADPDGNEAGDWWDPRTYSIWYLLPAAKHTVYDQPIEATERFHRRVDRDAGPLTAGRRLQILLMDLPAQQITGREISIAALEGRGIDYSVWHTAGIGISHHSGFSSMVEGGVGFDFASRTGLTLGESVARFSGGLSQLSGNAALAFSAPGAMTGLHRFGTEAVVNTFGRVAPAWGRRALTTMVFESGLEVGISRFAAQTPTGGGLTFRMAPAAPARVALPVLNRSFALQQPPSLQLQRLLQTIVSEENASLAINLGTDTKYLSPRELVVSRIGHPRASAIGPMSYGKVVERMVAQAIEGDPLLRLVFDPSGIGRRGPDVLGVGPGHGLSFEITTNNMRSVIQHQNRYGNRVIIVTYDRPLTFRGFP
jgi:RHS repeat-associated protein